MPVGRRILVVCYSPLRIKENLSSGQLRADCIHMPSCADAFHKKNASLYTQGNRSLTERPINCRIHMNNCVLLPSRFLIPTRHTNSFAFISSRGRVNKQRRNKKAVRSFSRKTIAVLKLSASAIHEHLSAFGASSLEWDGPGQLGMCSGDFRRSAVARPAAFR